MLIADLMGGEEFNGNPNDQRTENLHMMDRRNSTGYDAVILICSLSLVECALMFHKFAWAVCALAFVFSRGGDALAERPNILFIYTDDQAPSAVGFNGNKELKTPNIDRIAREGVRLPNAMTVTPVCSPSRASLATSRYASELGILDWINPNSEKELGLNPNTVTWMELLQEVGYATSLSGKWHLGIAPRFHPTLHGFDEFMGILEGGCPPKNPVLEIGGHNTKTEGFTVDLVTEHALDFIKRNQTGPFLCCVHYREPHAAWLPVRDEDWEPYRDLDPTLPEPSHPEINAARVKKNLREYYASVAAVDRNVGRLLKQLDELKLRENTVVIFTSDHGYHNGHYGLWYKGNAQWQTKTLPKQKWDNIRPKQRPNLYDQALRVPTAVRWPGTFPAGKTVDAVVSNLDWFPTLIGIAGVEQPKELTVRGDDIYELLTGDRTDWETKFYAEYSMRHGAKTDMRCWRTDEWKLMIDFANEGRGELYHLTEDPLELKNLFTSKALEATTAREALSKKIMSRLKEIGDPLLVDIDVPTQ